MKHLQHNIIRLGKFPKSLAAAALPTLALDDWNSIGELNTGFMRSFRKYIPIFDTYWG